MEGHKRGVGAILALTEEICEPWIQTFKGRAFWPLNPNPEDILIEDIAHALSFLARFGGHTQFFYSVGEHSVRVCDYLLQNNTPYLALQGLLHDASEAYLVDMPRPIKQQLKDYAAIEDKLILAINKHFGLPDKMDPKVKEADEILLSTEARDLMGEPPRAWHKMPPPLEEKIVPWTFEEAEFNFLEKWDYLTGYDCFSTIKGNMIYSAV